jgi:hypothetical protein
VVNIQLRRKVSESIDRLPGWALVYGRRKVGKTYILENFVSHDVYMAVRIDGSIWVRGMDFDHLGAVADVPRVVNRLLKDGSTVVIDEFQRLPMWVLEDIARAHPSGRLILSGSSMRVSREMMGSNSPLLAMLRAFRIGPVSPSDLLAGLSSRFSPTRSVEHAPILRDPWTVPFFVEKDPLRHLVDMLPHLVPGLVGEIFSADERELTRTYSAVLAIVGSGDGDPKKIAKKMHDRGITRTGASSNVIPFMNNMVEMGMLERTKVYGRRKYDYSIPSFPMTLFYYLDSRYTISDGNVPFDGIRPTAEAVHRQGIESLIADLLVEVVGGRKELLKTSDREIDVLVTVRRKPALVGEVKWGKAGRADVDRFLEKVDGLRCRRVFVCRRRFESDEVDVLTPTDLVEMARGHIARETEHLRSL